MSNVTEKGHDVFQAFRNLQPTCLVWSHGSHLHEREDEAHCEVGHPVKRTSNYVGCWAVGLFEQLRSYQERDPRWKQMQQ